MGERNMLKRKQLRNQLKPLRNLDKTEKVYQKVRKVLPKMTPAQLDSVQHEIRSMLLDLEVENESERVSSKYL